MTARWGRRDTRAVIASAVDCHSPDDHGYCPTCGTTICPYPERADRYLSFVNPSLLHQQVLRDPPKDLQKWSPRNQDNLG
jgi:hypothetical protein